MTELIDEFQPAPKGRGKALTLLILTSIGSLVKLAFTTFVFYMAFSNGRGQYMGRDQKFSFLTLGIVAFCGLLNFMGSLLMLKRRKIGIWIYLVSQLVTVLMITWTTLAVNPRLHEEEQVFLLIVFGVTIVYVVLYLTNWKYFSTRPLTDDEKTVGEF